MNTRDKAIVTGLLVIAGDRIKEGTTEARKSADGVLIARDIRNALVLLEHAAEIAEKDGEQLAMPFGPPDPVSAVMDAIDERKDDFERALSQDGLSATVTTNRRGTPANG